jgi:hypothetical protein
MGRRAGIFLISACTCAGATVSLDFGQTRNSGRRQPLRDYVRGFHDRSRYHACLRHRRGDDTSSARSHWSSSVASCDAWSTRSAAGTGRNDPGAGVLIAFLVAASEKFPALAGPLARYALRREGLHASYRGDLDCRRHRDRDRHLRVAVSRGTIGTNEREDATGPRLALSWAAGNSSGVYNSADGLV